MDTTAPVRQLRARLEGPRATTRRLAALLALLVVIAAGTQCTTPPPPVGGTRIDLVVLVLDNGQPTGVGAVREQLAREGVPFRRVDLRAANRPVIDQAFLWSATSTTPVQERAHFQAVVSADEGLTGLTPAERDAVFDFERRFGIRHVTAATWANPEVGLSYAQDPGYIGNLDGMTATVTAAGLASPFTYLNGPLPIDVGSYATVAPPLTPPRAGTTFTPLVTVPIPGANAVGSIIGTYQADGREQLVITTAINGGQQHTLALGHGIITWMTKGVHLGHARNYLTVHVDDLYAADARWNSTANCTPTEDCPPSVPPGPDIRMSAADVKATVDWQQANGFTFDMAYNGFGADSWIEEHGSDPLLAETKAAASRFHWINHTYTHEFLGCRQDVSVIPWRCQTDAAGRTVWVDRATIEQEITKNIAFATTHGLPINRSELVTGEHSGMFVLPQQPQDNPNLAPALAATGIAVTGADASRQFESRLIGNTRTVPRYPMANFYNVGTKAEMADEYNWIFTSKADGGSGVCEEHPDTMTCLEPISTSTGYDDFIVPFDTATTLRHVLGNDPRPHYVHQSNLAEERILLPLMSSVLGRYRSLVKSTAAPTVHVTETQAAELLARQSTWASGSSQVEAYTLNGTLYVERRGFTGAVPITVPRGSVSNTTGAAFGEVYAQESSAWSGGNEAVRVVLGTGS